MSLEQTINENTIAIRDLIAVLKMQGYAQASQPAEIPGFDKAVESIAKVADEITTSAATGATEQDPAPAPEPEPKVEVSYAEAAAAVTKLSRTKGRDAAVALLAEFKATKLPDVPAEKYADVVRAAEQMVA